MDDARSAPGFLQHACDTEVGHGEVDRTSSTTRYYDDRPALSRTNSTQELQALGRRIWQRFYPDEPLP